MEIRKILLITSNVGSLFGEQNIIRNFWLDQIAKTVDQRRPSFLALHIQESGGKNYKIHSKEMVHLVFDLQMRLAAYGFSISRSFLDVQYEIVEEYTALSSLYFVHDSIANRVSQYNFRQRIFFALPSEIDAQKRLVITSGLVRSGLVRKEKFSRDFWPNFRFGRKGFLHTRWKILDSIFDMINVHLFHDESNLNFLENPDQYSNNRRNALNYVLHKFEKFNGGSIEGGSNLFIFGDFNFRLNLPKFIKKLTMKTNEREIFLCSSSSSGQKMNKNPNASLYDSPRTNSSSLGDESSEDSFLSKTRSFSTEPSASSSETDDFRTSCDDYDEMSLPADNLNSSMMRRKNSVIEYYKPIIREYLSPFDGSEGNTNWVLRIGRKRFEYFDPEWLLREWKLYAEDDCEAKNFPLLELRPEFPPTYPWNEEPNSYKRLMTTRAPAWCDRILFNNNVYKHFVQNKPQACTYCSFGTENCIGDHKPVLLVFELPSS